MKNVPIDPASLTASVMERFAAFTQPDGECLVWTGYVTDKGYGKFNLGGRIIRAHRLAYVAATGADVPDGLEIDHTCNARSCVRSEHLEAVDHRENLRRGASKTGASLRAEESGQCARGHDRARWWAERKSGTGFCRRCKNDRQNKRARERYNSDPEYRAKVRAYQAERHNSLRATERYLHAGDGRFAQAVTALIGQ